LSFGTNKLTNTFDFFIDEGVLQYSRSEISYTSFTISRVKAHHSPLLFTFTNVQDEPPQYILSFQRVSNFRVELNSVNFLLVVSDRGERCRFGSGDSGEIFGEGV
jgi:hypothetical protein